MQRSVDVTKTSSGLVPHVGSSFMTARCLHLQPYILPISSLIERGSASVSIFPVESFIVSHWL